MITTLVSLLIPVLTAFFVLELLIPQPLYRVEKFCLAIGVGFGVSSFLFFIWSQLINMSAAWFTVIELSMLTTVFYCWYIYPHYRADAVDRNKATWSSMVLSFIFLVALLISITIFIKVSALAPHGQWDAWAIWNHKARLWFHSGALPEEAFLSGITISHPDYPLLLPGLVASRWAGYTMNDTTLVPVMVAALYTFGAIGLLVSSLRRTKGMVSAAVAGLILICSASYFVHGTNQYADVPLGYYLLSVFILLAASGETDGASRWKILLTTGFCAGCAAWMKNEGVMMLMALVLIYTLCSVVCRRWEGFVKNLLAIFTGAAAPLAVLIYFKLFIAGESYLNSHEVHSDLLARITTPERYNAIIGAFTDGIFSYSSAAVSGYSVSVIFLILVGMAIVGKGADWQNKIVISMMAMILAACFVGYSLVYLITPIDLDWHINRSLTRLLTQLWPGFLFLCFYAVRPRFSEC